MGRYVSIWLNAEQARKLERIAARESKRRRRRVTVYEIVKEWVLERLGREDA